MVGKRDLSVRSHPPVPTVTWALPCIPGFETNPLRRNQTLPKTIPNCAGVSMRQDLREFYEDVFLFPADKKRWARNSGYFHPVHGRDRDCWFVNTDYEIANGKRNNWVVGRKSRKTGKVITTAPRIQIPKLRWGVIRRNLTAINGKYILAKYPLNRVTAVRFIPFDIDLGFSHDEDHVSDPEVMDWEIQEFKAKVEAYASTFDLLGLEYVMYKSPGNITNGKHYQGVHGFIWLEEEIQTETAAEFSKALVQLYPDVKGEWQIRDKKLFRLPFQRFMDVINPYCFSPLAATNHPLVTFESAVDYVRGLSGTPIQKITDIIQQAKSVKDAEVAQDTDSHSVKTNLEAIQTANIQDGKISVVTPALVTRRTSRCSAWSIDQCRDEHDTFRRQTARKIGSRLVWEHHLHGTNIETLIQNYKDEMKLIAPRYPDGRIKSRTCNDPIRLDKTVRRWFSWYEKTFDSTKGNRQRDVADRERFNVVYSTKDILRYCLLGLRFDDKKIISRILKRARKYNGRLAATFLYDLCGGKNIWFRIRGLISRVIGVLDEYSKEERKCRQYGLTENALRRIHEGQERAVMMKKEKRRKKREIVDVTPLSTDSDPSLSDNEHDPLIADLVALLQKNEFLIPELVN